MKKFRYPLLTRIVLLVVLIGVSGCSTVKKTTDPFKSKQRINLAPFVEQLTTLVGDIQFGLKQKQPIYIQPFIDTPEVSELKDQYNQFRKNTANILAYTARVITLAQSGLPQSEQVNLLVDFIYDLRPVVLPPAPVEFSMPEEQIDEILESTRQQETLLEALRTIQPIATEVSVFMRNSVDELDDMAEKAEESIRDRILARHQEVLSYLHVLKKRRAGTLSQLEGLNQYRFDVTETLDSVLQHDPELQAVISPETAPNFKDLNRMERILTDRLALLNEQFEYLKVPMEIYLKQEAELNERVENVKETLRKVKLSVIIWSRMHRMMASGITDPAKIDVFGLMKSAVDKAL